MIKNQTITVRNYYKGDIKFFMSELSIYLLVSTYLLYTAMFDSLFPVNNVRNSFQFAITMGNWKILDRQFYTCLFLKVGKFWNIRHGRFCTILLDWKTCTLKFDPLDSLAYP